ncbi:MAG: gliding motility protein [Sphingobacteriaceae bacterium]|jgi:chaperone LolA|nr:gliding motility protein [Sphingobacteriaceae bacterium]
MKKIITVTFLLTFIAVAGFAQTDARAKSILAQVSQKYRTYNIIKADFTLTIDNPAAKIKQSQTGTIYVKSKTNKYKVTLKDQDLISDGKTQWTYQKQDKEVQVSDVDNSQNSINPAQIFTIYEKGYKYLYVGDGKINGRSTYTIDLSPVDTKPSFFKVRLSIDKANKTISNAIIFDKGGAKYTYLIRSFTPNVKVSESIFSFNPKAHPGVEVVDLR